MLRRLNREHHTFAFDRATPPAIDLHPGEILTVETLDATAGFLNSESVDPDTIDQTRVNPAGGPIRVVGAEPGDILAVDILDVRVAERGVMVVLKGVTAVADRLPGSQHKMIPIQDGHAILSERLRVPLDPMIGVVGVAPAGAAVGNLYGGDHGGNMDTRTIQAGSRVYLPVFVSGAMLGVGDLHATQGEGEIFLSAVEVAGEVDLRVQVLKSVSLPTPLVETTSMLAPISTGATLDEAANRALGKAFDLLTGPVGLDVFEAGRLVTAACHLMVSQYVPPAVIHCRVDIPKRLLAQLGFDLRLALGA